jgi:hypothetical protein
MVRKASSKDVHTETMRESGRRWFLTVELLGVMIFLSALPGFGPQVHELSYNNSFWMDESLNGSAAGTARLPMAAFRTTPKDQTHVYYVSAGQTPHIHQLFFNGSSWTDTDLTALTGAPFADQSTGVAGFSVANYQYIYYLATDPINNPNLHVHQLRYNNVRWVDSDLNALSGTSSIAAFSYLVAFTTTPVLHVYYVSAGPIPHIHQLFSNSGATWQDQDLTAITGGGSPAYALDGVNIGNLQYVYWTDRVTGHLHQLYYNNSSWSDTDITALTKIRLGLIQAAFVIPGTQDLRVYCLNATGKAILQLASPNNGNWKVTNLTQKSKGKPPDNNGAVFAFATTPNNEIHVFYVYESQVYQIYQPTPTTWENESLTMLGNGGFVAWSTGLSGFSVENYQYLYYIAQ